MKRGLKTCTTLRAAIIACVICAALLALTSANILFPGLSLAVFVLSSMPVLLMMIGLIAEVSDDQAQPDQTELEAVAWLTRAEARAVLAGEHPSVQAPPPFAIAHSLIQAWVEEA